MSDDDTEESAASESPSAATWTSVLTGQRVALEDEWSAQGTRRYVCPDKSPSNQRRTTPADAASAPKVERPKAAKKDTPKKQGLVGFAGIRVRAHQLQQWGDDPFFSRGLWDILLESAKQMRGDAKDTPGVFPVDYDGCMYRIHYTPNAASAAWTLENTQVDDFIAASRARQKGRPENKFSEMYTGPRRPPNGQNSQHEGGMGR